MEMELLKFLLQEQDSGLRGTQSISMKNRFASLREMNGHTSDRLANVQGLSFDSVVTVEDALDALRAVPKHHFDCILLGEDAKEGYETVEEIKRLGVEAPTFGVGSAPTETALPQFVAAGAAHYIQLPLADSDIDTILLHAVSHKSRKMMDIREPRVLRPCVSEALSRFLGRAGKDRMIQEAREVVWEYINDMRGNTTFASQGNRSAARYIICDQQLKDLFGCDRILAKHVEPALSGHLFL